MTVLAAIQNATTVIGLTRPSVVFSSSDREHIELQALVNTCADYIAKDYEWQKFKTLATITGDGTDTTFALPSDYDRMLKDANLWSANYIAPLTHITSTDRWLELDIRQFSFVIGAWSLFSNEINIKPAPALNELVKYYYMSNLIVAPEAGLNKTAFTLDTDTFRLSEKLLELCIIWRWRAQKGLPYAQDQDNYEDAKEKLISSDKGARVIMVGPQRRIRGVNIAYPVSIIP